MTVHLQVLSVNRAKAFRRCPRFHFYSHEQRIRPVRTSGPLALGSATHDALETWWRAEGNRWDAVKAWLDAPTHQGKPYELDPYDREYVRALLAGYDARWQTAEPVAVEREFVMPLVNPATDALSKTWEVRGRIDAIARFAGELWVVEHKTASDDIGPGSDYWRRLRLDAQVSTYIEAARSIGYDVRGVLYDVLGKPALRPLKATPVESRKYTKQGALYANQRLEDETPEEYGLRLLEHLGENPNRYYARCDVVRLEDEADEARADLWQTAQAIRESQRAQRWPKNPDACWNYHRECEFFGICTRETSADDASRYERRDECKAA